MKSAPWQDEAFLAARDLYLAAIDGPFCKIGVSRKPKQRVAQLSTTQPHKAKLIKVWPKAGQFEPVCHHVLMPLGQRGEWFKCKPDFAAWVCDTVIANERERAAHGVGLYKQIRDCEARSERLRGFGVRDREYKDEAHRLLGLEMSLEDDLEAAGFNATDYRYLNQYPGLTKEQAEHLREREERLRIERERQVAQYKLMQQVREKQRHEKDIASLAPRHIAALRAVVASNGLDEFDAFTFDVLGRIGLLTRRKGSKAKTDWLLTDEGRAALERHSQPS
jgi:hypothetical protein